MIKVTKSQIEAKLVVCPYCMNDWSPQKNIVGCCGEVECQTAYLIDGEVYLESDVEVRDEKK